MFLVLLSIGESHIFRLNNFYNEYANTTIYPQKGISDSEMILDVQNSAKRNNVDFFVFQNSPRNIFSSEFTIYGSQNAETSINERSDIYEKNYSSLFLGNINIEFESIDKLENFSNIQNYYLIGNDEDIKQFKMELINKYAGNHPIKGSTDNEQRNMAISVWIILICMTAIFTFYDVISQKKEMMIKISFGERISVLVLKNIIVDSIVILSVFFTVFLILKKYTMVNYNLGISIIMLGIMLGVNSMIYLNLYFINLKEIFSNSFNAKKTLVLTYFLKFFSVILTVFIISSNLSVVFSALNLYKQKEFFKSHSDYYFIEFVHRPVENSDGSTNSRFEDDAIINEKFYKEFFNTFKPLVHSGMSYSLSLGFEVIQVNSNSLEPLSKKIRELEKIDLNKPFYVLIPENKKNDSNVTTILETENIYDESSIIYYKENLELIKILKRDVYESHLVKNPIVVLDNSSGVVSSEFETSGGISNTLDTTSYKNYLLETMYKISEDDLNKFIIENKLTDQIILKTNVYDNYIYQWTIEKRLLYINSIFTVLVLILEFLIIYSLIRLTYNFNALELSVKKILGDSIIEKNKKIIISTILVTVFSTLLALLFSLSIGIGEFKSILIGGSIILIFELSTLVYCIAKVEKSKIPEILKGGNL